MELRVVKIGTSLLRGNKKYTTLEMINNYSTCIASSKDRGDKVVVVTSGAVGLGCHQLGIINRPENVVHLQAAAAIGQGHLMSLYKEAMGRHGYNVAQVLLTRSDLNSRNSFRNASMTLKQLLDWGTLPIVNENDALSTEELKYGDNDTLSALVATAINADQLILLTDIDKLYSSDPKKNINAKPISDIHHLSELKKVEKEVKNSGWGTGGITTKLAAARIATASGITVHLADGRNPMMLDSVLKGSRGGTVFHPHPEPIENRKNWLAHAIKPIGDLHIDKGACEAIQDRGASLLLVGIKTITGAFAANQPVRLIDSNGNEMARGISSISSQEISASLKRINSLEKSPIVVHRDVLVLTSDRLN